ncbi:hypothetical protein E2C01_017124 [Portunus trituberculatus]|uniref:Uncharacterized protein n=1 Tax=Portunus trituberculatus TaxID=210409 RepID=A0A5B7DSR4_PORTR|nr:hypothetical protein [Portunus trituberculatus]
MEITPSNPPLPLFISSPLLPTGILAFTTITPILTTLHLLAPVENGSPQTLSGSPEARLVQLGVQRGAALLLMKGDSCSLADHVKTLGGLGGGGPDDKCKQAPGGVTLKRPASAWPARRLIKVWWWARSPVRESPPPPPPVPAALAEAAAAVTTPLLPHAPTIAPPRPTPPRPAIPESAHRPLDERRPPRGAAPRGLTQRAVVKL